MIIRVLPELESRDAWLAFMRREQPYCLIERPQCLVDFQTHYLQLTLFPHPELAHRDPVRYSLGSRQSMQPAWNLVRGCHWSLRQVIEGLEQLDFSSNVRDNSLLKLHGDLTVRKRFVRETRLIAPAASGLLHPLIRLPKAFSVLDLSRLLANRQFQDWRAESAGAPSPQACLLALEQQPDAWQIAQRDGRLVLFYEGAPLLSFIADLSPRRPRLTTAEGRQWGQPF